ncbi:MAG: 16S rRNA (cytosine(1402)-N(4))-methyltransferase RsmH [Pseudomonadales bacterium]|nr:16S rRNA (cytosine(1402)-N(4))-methyltransferase RsmH [Pseudomonadales bacterium]
MDNAYEHTSVLLRESVEGLVTDPSGIYVDGTLGRGGHTAAILEKLDSSGKVIAIDKDEEAIAFAAKRFANEPRLTVVHGSFSELSQIIDDSDLKGKVAGVLLDLGVSSPQLDDATRGFSFINEGPLDMRMDTSRGETAAQWVNRVTAEEMADVFKRYGEERFAKRIARAVVEQRDKTPFETTTQLAKVIAEANPKWEKHKNPATRCFQAIRIHINRELEDISETLEQILEVLAVGGRMSVISFHSLEDRIVKQFIRKHVKGDEMPRGLPVRESELNKRLKSLGKAIKASADEVDANVRARSAVLRVAEKIK